ncbi:MAG: hypothetical protein PHN72_05510 [Bacilli bacterium]|nr:hypothetical protein [Bacilli bacterium]
MNNSEFLNRETKTDINIYTQKDAATLEKEALLAYAVANGILLEFSPNGLAHDTVTNDMYDASLAEDGSVSIKKIPTAIYEKGSKTTEQETIIDVIKDGVSIKTGNKQAPLHINMNIVKAAMAYSENEGYIDFLKDQTLGLSEVEQKQYITYIRNILQKRNGENTMGSKEKEEVHAKPYVLKAQKPKRNGYVNAVLLTVITSLFGVLCLSFLFTSITGA